MLCLLKRFGLLSRLLESEIQKLQKDTAEKERQLKLQLEELKRDNDRQQKLIGQVCEMLCENMMNLKL